MMWFTLQSIPSLVATETVWRRRTGSQFEAFNALCLQPSSFAVRHVPCPHGCGCDHLVVPRHDGAGAVGVCRCRPALCPDLALSRADITALEVSNDRLGSALCRAFGFERRQAQLPIPGTFQFGAWSSDAVPAILTLQVRRPDFRRAVAEVAASRCRSFLLFGPTSDFLDAPAQSILESHGAAFYDLRTHVALASNGTLHATRPPGHPANSLPGSLPSPKRPTPRWPRGSSPWSSSSIPTGPSNRRSSGCSASIASPA